MGVRRPATVLITSFSSPTNKIRRTFHTMSGAMQPFDTGLAERALMASSLLCGTHPSTFKGKRSYY